MEEEREKRNDSQHLYARTPGGANKIARQLKIKVGTVTDWQEGKSPPQLHNFLRKRKKREGYLEAIEKSLRAILNSTEGPAPSLRQVAIL